MSARPPPGAPIQPACGIQGFSALDGSSDEIRIAQRPAIVKKPPAFLRDTNAAQVQTRDQYFFFGTRSARHNFAERIGYERAAPKTQITFTADAIHRSCEDAV